MGLRVGADKSDIEGRRNARIYLIGLGTSLLGNSAMSLVAGIWVKSLTGSSSAAAVVSVCVYAPSLLGLVAGMVADRVRRRPMLMVLNLASGVAVLPLLLLGGGVVAALDAATFVIAAIALTRLRITEPLPTKETRHWRAELVAGFTHIRQLPEMRAVVIAGAVAMGVSGVAVPAVYGLIDGLHRAPSFLGVLTSLLGAGSIIASLTSGPMIRRIGERRLAVLGLLDGVIGYVLRATATIPTALASSFVLGFALPWTVVAVINLTQRGTPSALQGRVSAAVMLALFAPVPVAQAVGAVVIDRAGYRLVYLAAAAVTLATATWLVIRPRPASGARSG
ncbi:MAG TPA: MFS transporter [Pseudonocardiaceae bacterium]